MWGFLRPSARRGLKSYGSRDDLSRSMINPIDRDALRQQVRRAEPFPFFCIDDFLDRDFAAEVEAAYPTFEEAARLGQQFDAVNERGKIQIEDSRLFPPAIARLHQELCSEAWLGLLGDVMGIDGLVVDPDLVGGGIHETRPHGHLDVHVDFNFIREKRIYRRLNILVYFNSNWREEWGGKIELWDPDVRTCHHAFAPAFNRCVVFETSEISFHGVTALSCPDDVVRKSFAGYYYTEEAPAGWSGEHHSTVFRARPNERMKGMVWMPFERIRRNFGERMRGISRRVAAR